jgi:hypothetical protein
MGKIKGNVQMKKQRNYWKLGFFILLVILILILGLWVSWGEKTYNTGYDDGYNQSSYDSRDYYVNASLGLIGNSINDSINEMTLEFSNKCIKYFCENIFESNYIEGNAESNYLGRCDGEEYKSVGALEECRAMFFGE